MARLGLLLLVCWFVYSAASLVSVRYQQRLLYVDLGRAQAVENELGIDWRYLQLERAKLTTNARIQQVTTQKLNMQIPHIGQIIYIKDSELANSPASPATQQSNQ
ncbi:cell division protein FtsL [Advenella alkanexedens]|jgi:cell division protein FtsL|uniref:Cell division protein FtsL n=1 Tax=Advenella alkanexedens TaxID=1481665 RepID=A0ABS6NQB9_9BURK|nr:MULTISPECIES: cell division protein FtsL [Advenella]MBV4397837.1 cell division protein FtsL [Advenella alkanexedens]MDD3756908.1 cell division protein FtsL [Advenella sp.]NLN66935.1 cell division protein FtsL [Alcaligenaceae bacterium]